jgi:hypothetical protein
VRLVLTEYQLHQLCWPACGAVTRAGLRAGVPTKEFGSWVQAIASLCTEGYHLSKQTARAS